MDIASASGISSNSSSPLNFTLLKNAINKMFDSVFYFSQSPKYSVFTTFRQLHWVSNFLDNNHSPDFATDRTIKGFKPLKCLNY